MADHDWFDPRYTDRLHIPHPEQAAGDARDEYERDLARIIHSLAFRKLQGKTQVFATGAHSDFLRTRVTHSIEVAQIGRALAKRVGVPEALVEAACLGHDLGHPPFGHTGEQALNELMEEHGGFEGNAQTFRIVTYLELKHPDYEGLDLCRLTLLSLIKYPYRRSSGSSKYLYDVDVEREGGWLFEGMGESLLTTYDRAAAPPRTLPCQLMDWADDIAYSVHDLEDGIASGILQPHRWADSETIDAIYGTIATAPVRWEAGPPDKEIVRSILLPMSEELVPFGSTIPMDVIREFTRKWINTFATAGTVISNDTSSPYGFKYEIPEEIWIQNQVLKAITFEYLIRDHRTAAVAHRGRLIVSRLFKTLLANTRKDAGFDRHLLFPRHLRETLRSYGGDATDTARFVCDFVASLTEGQAVDLYGRLFDPMRPVAGPGG